MNIRLTRNEEYPKIRAFYHRLIDEMQEAVYKPLWEKGVYPADHYLASSIQRGELWVYEQEEGYAAVMILNHSANEGYAKVTWSVSAKEQEILVLHALGVLPSLQRKGIAGAMVEHAIALAKKTGQKTLRLDVLEGNLPAERLYEKHGFAYMDTVSMFYEDTGWTNFKLYEYLWKGSNPL